MIPRTASDLDQRVSLLAPPAARDSFGGAPEWSAGALVAVGDVWAMVVAGFGRDGESGPGAISRASYDVWLRHGAAAVTADMAVGWGARTLRVRAVSDLAVPRGAWTRLMCEEVT